MTSKAPTLQLSPRFFALFTLLALAGLQGCARIYTAPATGPTATLNITGPWAGGRKGIHLFLYQQGDCSRNVIFQEEGKDVDVPVAIPAGRPLILQRGYEGGNGYTSVSCNVTLQFTPQEGQTYESRMLRGIGNCSHYLLRVRDNGRTEVPDDLKLVKPDACMKAPAVEK